VAARIINADQKAQVLKKPALKAQLDHLEETQSLLTKISADIESSVTAKITEKLTEQFEKEKAEAAELAKADQKKKFLSLSMFLRLVADRRAEGADPSVDQNAALEAVLAVCFGGDEDAVSTMEKLVIGVDEKVVGVTGEQLSATFAQLKEDSEAHMSELARQAAETAADATEEASTDPTIANIAATETAAGDKELESTDATPAVATETNGVHPPAQPVPSVEDNDQDDAPEAQDEPAPVPSAPGAEAAVEELKFPAPTHTASWADDHPEPAAQVLSPTLVSVIVQSNTGMQGPPATDADDGFTAVQRNKPRNEGWRGRGRGEWRGKGGRGDGRGRGRGGGRGGMPHRAPRRDDA
jgi:hypothetical protein